MTTPSDPTNGDDKDAAIQRLEKALDDALTRSETAESTVEEQRERLKALGLGREETMRALTEARDELRRMTVERDELRKQLTRVDAVQTSTIGLPDDEEPVPATPSTVLPSLDDLMATLGHVEDTRGAAAGHLHQRVYSALDDAQHSMEMLSPELVFPEQYAGTAEAGSDAAVNRVLVLLDAEKPIKYPLYKETMTIGRADAADIQIDNGFLSRVHARVISTADGVSVEDVESKNGIKVNGKLVPKAALRHGDVVDLGRLRFRFIDTSADDLD